MTRQAERLRLRNALVVTGQTENSEVGATTLRGAEMDAAASGGSAAEAVTSARTGAGSGPVS